MPPRGWRADPTERFEAKYTPEPNTGCWLWTGADDGTGRGYGRIRMTGGSRQAHHVALRIYTGQIVPPGMEVDHKCRMPCCVNPDHLEIVTRQENMRRVPGDVVRAQRRISGAANGLRQKAKTHCPQGHSYYDAIITKQGWRVCRQCFYAKTKRQAAARKARLQLVGE